MSGNAHPELSGSVSQEALQAISDPVCVLVAQTNVDAHLKAILLRESGIRAVAVDDLSLGGYFPLGALKAIHRPEVFVDRSDLNTAQAALSRFGEEWPAGHPVSFCFHCGVELPAGGEFPRCPECCGELEECLPTVMQERSDQALMRGRSLFQGLQKAGALVMLLLLLPLVLRGLYVLSLLVAAPFRW